VSGAVAPEEVVDIFTAAALKKPDISILSDEFLAQVRGLPHRNLAIELLRWLLSEVIRSRGRKNIVQARSLAEMLEQAIHRYQTGPSRRRKLSRNSSRWPRRYARRAAWPHRGRAGLLRRSGD
jgi:type I site-specific restriction-modification system R (restriction) subunit